jgi:hypothetical protein
VKERKTPLSDGKSAVEVIRVLEGASEKLRLLQKTKKHI